MDTIKANESRLPANHQTVLDRFVKACQADDRITAAFLGGSYARDAADAHSDLDLYLITTDEDFEDFYARRRAFMQLLGEPVFIEDFDIPNIIFYILADGTDGEVGLGSESRFDDIHSGPYKVLLDKKGILTGVVFASQNPGSAEQTEKLRRLIYWFWHNLSHFITALGRGQLWWARGQLEELRRYCVNLARLRHNFADPEAGQEPYFKLETLMPVEQLSPLQPTFCPMAHAEMLAACLTLVQFYRELAIPLANAHGISYPDVLEWVMLRRLENIRYDHWNYAGSDTD